MKPFERFFETYWRGEPLLLGLSGGADSLLLFELLLEKRVPFHVAHIDHGWRQESSREAKRLQSLCSERGVPFHLSTLNPQQLQGNLEDACRQARHERFRALCHEQGLYATCLGHHSDDQAETVLKRIFEGAPLTRLKGLTPVTSIDGLTLWRPLLKLTKSQIYAAIADRGLTPLEDPTNRDPRFLRSRLRHDLLPDLARTFGKEIRSSLCRLGEYGNELEEFLEHWLATYRHLMEPGRLDLSQTPPTTAFAWKAVVRDFFQKEKMTLSHATLDAVIGHLKKRNPRKFMVIGKSRICCDRGVLSVLKENPI